jgi:hypothetical protein
MTRTYKLIQLFRICMKQTGVHNRRFSVCERGVTVMKYRMTRRRRHRHHYHNIRVVVFSVCC